MSQQDIIINKNNYKVYEKIGVGETTGSVIQRAREATSLDFVAYKKINIRNEQTKQSVLHQIKYLKSLNHINIAKLYDQSMDKSEQYIYLFLELLQEYSLNKIILSDKTLPISAIQTFACDVRDALQYMHSKQALLNDVHAKNMLMTANGVLKLIEFGNACQFKQPTLTYQKIESSICKNGYVHRAPETLLEGGVYSTASDIYSFGQLIYFMAFGFYPYEKYRQQTNSVTEFAKYLIAHEENVAADALQQAPLYDQGQSSQELLELIHQMIQPLPFKRINWDELGASRLLKSSQQLIVRENQQTIYFQFLNQCCQAGVFGQKYQALQFDIQSGEANDMAKVRKTQMVISMPKGRTVSQSQAATGADAPSRKYQGVNLKIIRKLSVQQYEKLQQYITVQKQIKVDQKFYQEYIEMFMHNKLIEDLRERPLKSVMAQQNSVQPPNHVISVQSILKMSIDQNNLVQNDQIYDNLAYIASHSASLQNEQQLHDVIGYCVDQLPNCNIKHKLYDILCLILQNNNQNVCQLLKQSRVNCVGILLDSLVDSQTFMQTVSGYQLYAQLLQIFLQLFITGMLKYHDFKIFYQKDFEWHLDIFLEATDSKLADDNSSCGRQQMLQLLSQATSFYLFIFNVTQMLIHDETVRINECRKSGQRTSPRQNLSGQFQLTAITITAQNIYMQLHQDQYQASVRQLGLIKQLVAITQLSTECFSMLTDLRLHAYLDVSQIKIQYFDFTLVSGAQNRQAAANIIAALANTSYLEQYSVIDFCASNYIKNNLQPSQRQLDIYILNNKNTLFQILDQAYDKSFLYSVTTLLHSMLFNDSFLEIIVKNPLNIKNHKLYRFIKIDGDIIGKIDQLITRAGDSGEEEQTIQSAAFLVNIIQIILDISTCSVKQYSIQGAYLNTKYYNKCLNCLEMLDRVYGYNFECRYLLITAKQVLNLESIIFALSNTIYEIKPEQSNQYYGSLNMSEFYQYVEAVVEAANKYINSPWEENVRKNLFANQNNKFKGLWYAMMSLLKCPSYPQIAASKTESGQLLCQILQQLRSKIPQYFKQSFEKYLENGPVGQNLFTKTKIYKQINDQTFAMLINMPQLGLTVGDVFSVDDASQNLKVLQQAILRFITSKSMFIQLFSELQCEHAFVLLDYVLDIVIDQIAPECLSDYYQICTLFLNNVQAQHLIQYSYQVIRQLIRHDVSFMLRATREKVLSQAVIDIRPGIRLIEGYCGKFVDILQSKLQGMNNDVSVQQVLNNRENRSLIVQQVKYISKQLFERLAEELCQQFAGKRGLCDHEYVVSSLNVLLYISQIFLYSKASSIINVELIRQLEMSFADGITSDPDRWEAGLVLPVLDLVLQYNGYLAENWAEYQGVKRRIAQAIGNSKERLGQQVIYKLQQINGDMAVVQYPNEWVSE